MEAALFSIFICPFLSGAERLAELEHLQQSDLQGGSGGWGEKEIR